MFFYKDIYHLWLNVFLITLPFLLPTVRAWKLFSLLHSDLAKAILKTSQRNERITKIMRTSSLAEEISLLGKLHISLCFFPSGMCWLNTVEKRGWAEAVAWSWRQWGACKFGTARAAKVVRSQILERGSLQKSTPETVRLPLETSADS